MVDMYLFMRYMQECTEGIYGYAYKCDHKTSKSFDLILSTYLLLAAESFAGRFSHRFTVTINAFLSKLYFMVQCKVPKTWLGSTKDVEAEEDARLLIPGSSDPINGPFSSVISARSPYISDPAPTNCKIQ